MSHRKLLITLLVLLLSVVSHTTQAQTNDDAAELKRQASELMKQTKYTEALPLLEKIATLDPNDGETQFYLGFALIGQAANTKDAAARKALRIRGRSAFVKAKALEFHEPRLDALIQGLPEDGSDSAGYSSNSKAEEFMREGEALFSQGKADEALKKYQQALEVDPKNYHAALFSGDIYLQKQDFAQAEIWYQKAIAIDPNRETAYRYSATPLMKQRKTEAARDRYVEAFIVGSSRSLRPPPSLGRLPAVACIGAARNENSSNQSRTGAAVVAAEVLGRARLNSEKRSWPLS